MNDVQTYSQEMSLIRCAILRTTCCSSGVKTHDSSSFTELLILVAFQWQMNVEYRMLEAMDSNLCVTAVNSTGGSRRHDA